MTLQSYFDSLPTWGRRAFAARLEVTESTISRWRSGDRTPEPQMAANIERATYGLLPLRVILGIDEPTETITAA